MPQFTVTLSDADFAYAGEKANKGESAEAYCQRRIVGMLDSQREAEKKRLAEASKSKDYDRLVAGLKASGMSEDEIKAMLG